MIRERLCASARRAEPLELSPPDRVQEMAQVAKGLVATMLESLGKRLASTTSQASEPGPTARGATRVGKTTEEKPQQAETAASKRASSQASLDKLTREVLDTVCCPLQSFVASQI